jgi:hypothetical protein
MSVFKFIKSLRDALGGSNSPELGSNQVGDFPEEAVDPSATADAKNAPNPGSFVVPDGCNFEVYPAPPPVHALNRARGGCLLASMGVLTDRGPSELGALLAKVDEAIRERVPKISLVTGAIQLSDLFSNAVATTEIASIVWILEPRAFFLSQGERLLIELIDKWINLKISVDVTSIIFLKPADAPVVTAVASTLAHAGFSYRQPGDDGAYIYCAEHADGKVVTALGGPPTPGDAQPSLWFRSSSECKRRAERMGDHRRVADIESEQRSYLRQILRRDCSLTPALDLASRFRQLLNRAYAGQPGAYRDFLERMRGLDAPLIYICNPDSSRARAMQVVTFPGNRTGVELFPDLHAAQIAMKDFKLDPQSTSLGILSPPHENLFKWLGESMLGASVWANGPERGAPPDSGVSVFVSPEHLGLLATGVVPDS